MGTIIAVDPGREKCGIAIVDTETGVLFQAIAETAHLAEEVVGLVTRYQTRQVVLGDGTSHRAVLSALRDLTFGGASLDIATVDERRSTDEARVRYWRENPPKGLRKLIPLGLQVPPGPVDDYVAVILAERYFHKCKNKP